jgi:hypothetical protein
MEAMDGSPSNQPTCGQQCDATVFSVADLITATNFAPSHLAAHHALYSECLPSYAVN